MKNSFDRKLKSCIFAIMFYLTWKMRNELKHIFLVLLFVLCAGSVWAQNATNSPYTRYGYGALEDAVPSNGKAMGGLAIGLRDKESINFANPASYTAMDSLTFLFDGGVTLQNTNFNDGTYRLNAKNSSVNYFAMQFRINKIYAMSFGLTPYSNVGYNLSQVYDDDVAADNYSILNFYGDGGLHQVYGGIGMKLLRNLSIGGNFSYIWGDIYHISSQVFPTNASAMVLAKTENVDVRSFKMDFGAQYVHRINSKNRVVLGAVFSPKQRLNNSATEAVALGSAVTLNDTVVVTQIPMSIGAGVTYVYDDRLTVGMDVMYQQWSKVNFMNSTNVFVDRTKISVGAEYLPALYGAGFFNHVKYRAGAYYSLPYYKIDGSRAAKEYGVSVGMGLPVARSGSLIHISGQYAHLQGQGASNLSENIFQVTIGLTFNERWFFKRRVN